MRQPPFRQGGAPRPIGVYGVVSRTVAMRTRGLGLRVALGARASDLSGMVLARSLTVAAVGAAAGPGSNPSCAGMAERETFAAHAASARRIPVARR